MLVAVTDPTNVFALDDVRVHLKVSDLEVAVTTDADLRAALTRVWSLSDDGAAAAVLNDLAEERSASTLEAELANVGGDVDEAPIVKLVDMILREGVGQGASDIHIEPQSTDVVVRFRVDGQLRDVMTVPKIAGPSLASRLKIMAGLDISERRRPQDGRARFVTNGENIDIRMSTLPALPGESIVMRLLPRAKDLPPLARVGLREDQLESLLHAVRQPQGLVLITGPTGSGKTSTLYSTLLAVRSREKHVITLEDPVEIALAGITQVGVSEKAGLTFAAGLRSILRQDPDVILVGEVRDGETARLALQASLTGHLVLTTLHTNDAIGAVARSARHGSRAVPGRLRAVARRRAAAGAQALHPVPGAVRAQPAGRRSAGPGPGGSGGRNPDDGQGLQHLPRDRFPRTDRHLRGAFRQRRHPHRHDDRRRRACARRGRQAFPHGQHAPVRHRGCPRRRDGSRRGAARHQRRQLHAHLSAAPAAAARSKRTWPAAPGAARSSAPTAATPAPARSTRRGRTARTARPRRTERSPRAKTRWHWRIACVTAESSSAAGWRGPPMATGAAGR